MKTRFQTILFAALALNAPAFSQQSQKYAGDHERTAPIAPDERERDGEGAGEQIAARRALALNEWQNSDGRGLEISGGRAGEWAFLVFGHDSAAIDLPFGGRLMVHPELALAAGRFGSDGTLQFALPQGPEGVAPAGEEEGDERVLAQALALGGLEVGELSGRTSNVVDLTRDPNQGEQPPHTAQLRYKLEGTDTQPILELSMWSRSRYRVEVERFEPESIADDGARMVIKIYVRTYPVDGEVAPVPVAQKMRFQLETQPTAEVEVYRVEGDGSEGSYEKIAPISDEQADTAD